MFDKNEMERNDPLKDYYGEIGDGMEPPPELVNAVKTGVYLNPAAKTRTHVWKFAKAIMGYALGVILFFGVIAILPSLWESGQPAQPGTSAPPATADSSSPSVPSEALKAEIIAAYARQFGADEENLSVRIIAQFDDLCAVWIDNEGAAYLDVIKKYTAFGLTFDYGSAQQILIYKRGIDYFYTISEAAHYDKFLSKEFTRKIYLAYYSKSLDSKEKLYCTATVDDDFSENQIFVAVFPEFNEYPYSAEDFAMIGCTKVEEIATIGDVGQNGEASQYRFLLLTLDKQSKENVLSAVKRLEVELDIYTAGPYGYEKTPEEQPPVTEPINIEKQIAEAITICYTQNNPKTAPFGVGSGCR